MQSEFPFGFGSSKVPDLREKFWSSFDSAFRGSGMTFKEFCESLGLNHRTAEAWLYRRSSPPVSMMRLILEKL
jgi:hypothetical protein